jgi:hypothetical protein
LFSLLVGKFTSDNELTHIIFLGQVKKLPDVVGALRTKTTWDGVIGKAWDSSSSNLCNDEVKNGNIVAYNAPTDGFALTFSSTALAVALVSLLHEEADAGVGEYTLTHGESLFVISSRDAEHVSLEFFAEGGSLYFLGNTAIVEVLELDFIFEFDDFLKSRGRT